jgi:hypothetical protein
VEDEDMEELHLTLKDPLKVYGLTHKLQLNQIMMEALQKFKFK